jgi:diguanylate cyclase (GGDEF)-like protein
MDVENQRAAALKHLAILDTPPEERFERLTRLATYIFNVPTAQVTLLDNERQWFKSIQGAEMTEIPRVITFCTHTVETEDGFMMVPDASLDPKFSANPLVADGPEVRFYAGVALVHTSGVRLGTFCILDTKPRVLTSEEIDILKDLAAVVERELVAIQIALVDDLTGLSNRSGFVVECSRLFQHASRNQQAISLVYIDLDDFKSINDRRGHAVGDKVLVNFSAALRDTFREVDAIARYGGDEFVVCCNDLSKQDVAGLLQRLRDNLAQQDSAVRIEFSAGVVTSNWQELDAGMDSLLSAADKKMYSSKKNKTRNVGNDHSFDEQDQAVIG